MAAAEQLVRMGGGGPRLDPRQEFRRPRWCKKCQVILSCGQCCWSHTMFLSFFQQTLCRCWIYSGALISSIARKHGKHVDSVMFCAGVEAGACTPLQRDGMLCAEDGSLLHLGPELRRTVELQGTPAPCQAFVPEHCPAFDTPCHG